MFRIANRMLLAPSAVVLALVLSGCSSSSVEIRSAVASQDDTRVELALMSCNAELVVEVTEDSEEVVVTVSDADAPLFRSGGDACEDHYVVQFEGPLGHRGLVDGTTGEGVSVLRPPPDSGVPFPYDRDRVTESEYLDALDAMVSCLEAFDPELDAWVHQALDWMTYRWHKEPDEQGYLARPPALDICHEKHLRALEPPSNSRWTDEDLANAMGIWVNQLGLNRNDPDVWRDRLTEICSVAYATGETTIELGDVAFRYIEEDAEVSVRADGTLPQVEEATMALFQIADSPTCGIEPDTNAAAAWDSTAVMAPDDIAVDSAVAKPDTLVAVSFPDGRMRGIHFVLESVDGNGVVTLAYHLISDWSGEQKPRSFPADESGDLAIPDIGITGQGPDMVLIPADAPPGEYRICTGNSRPNICTLLTIEQHE